MPASLVRWEFLFSSNNQARFRLWVLLGESAGPRGYAVPCTVSVFRRGVVPALVVLRVRLVCQDEETASWNPESVVLNQKLPVGPYPLTPTAHYTPWCILCICL